MKKFLFILAIAFILGSCTVSFEKVSSPILAKYGQPDSRTLEKENEYAPNESNIVWGYINPKILVLFTRKGNTWKSEIREY